MNKFNNADWEVITYIYDKSPVGSELWREAANQLAYRQESMYRDLQARKNTPSQLDLLIKKK